MRHEGRHQRAVGSLASRKIAFWWRELLAEAAPRIDFQEEFLNANSRHACLNDSSKLKDRRRNTHCSLPTELWPRSVYRKELIVCEALRQRVGLKVVCLLEGFDASGRFFRDSELTICTAFLLFPPLWAVCEVPEGNVVLATREKKVARTKSISKRLCQCDLPKLLVDATALLDCRLPSS